MIFHLCRSDIPFYVEPPSIEKDCAVPVVVYDIGEEARLVCATVEGSPLPSVVWTREGVGVLMTGENRILLLDGDQVCASNSLLFVLDR